MMNTIDLIKKLSLVTALSTFALPVYASNSGDENALEDNAKAEAKTRAPKVLTSASSGPLTFKIVEIEGGDTTKKIMTMTNKRAVGVHVSVEGEQGTFTGKHSYWIDGEGGLVASRTDEGNGLAAWIKGEGSLAASSTGLLNIGLTTFNLGPAMTGEKPLAEVVASLVTPFLQDIALTKEEALEAAQKKALAQQAEALKKAESAQQAEKSEEAEEEEIPAAAVDKKEEAKEETPTVEEKEDVPATVDKGADSGVDNVADESTDS